MGKSINKKESTTQSRVAMKNCGSVVNPLYMTYSGEVRKIVIPSHVQCGIERIALELECLPEDVAAAWLEQMWELHG